jgi:hypothetical protein
MSSHNLVTAYTQTFLPNALVQRLTLRLRIWHIKGSNLGPGTSYPDWGFSWFFSVMPGKCLYSTLNQVTAASLQILYCSLFTHRPFVRRCIIWVTQKALLNELQTTSSHSGCNLTSTARFVSVGWTQSYKHRTWWSHEANTPIQDSYSTQTRRWSPQGMRGMW